ncbi:MAG: DinB family protein [Spirochaetales bacterium]|nr:DinB family protein [Spirochaetales bacterium]
MTDAISLFARYNDHVNRLMFRVLDDVDPELLNRSVGAYFGSIIGILNHILTSGLGWLVHFRDGGIPSQTLMDPTLPLEHPGFGKILHADYSTLTAHQREVDRVILDFVAELIGSGGDSPGLGPDQVFTYVNRKGEKHRFRVGDVLLHVLNHATHHRGQISQILDDAEIEHDYSNVWPLLEEPPVV